LRTIKVWYTVQTLGVDGFVPQKADGPTLDGNTNETRKKKCDENVNSGNTSHAQEPGYG
jgi:hypothetical protein